MGPRIIFVSILSYQPKHMVNYGSYSRFGVVSSNFGPLRAKSICLIFSTKCGLQRIIINLELETHKFDLAMEGPKFNESYTNLVHNPKFTIFRGWYLNPLKKFNLEPIQPA